MTPAELKTARATLGLTQAQLAHMLDADPRSVRRWESGSRAIHGSMVRLIRAYLAGYRPQDWP